MKMSVLRQTLGFAGCSPNFMAPVQQRLRHGQTNAGTRAGEKNMLHPAALVERR
jgi:hypothetical protein